MATRRDQPAPPAPMAFASAPSPRDLQPMRQHWKVTSAMPGRFRSTDQLLASRFRRVPDDDDEFLPPPPPAAAPVLPTIASLLSSSARGPSRPDDRRKLPVQVRERPPQTAAATSSGAQLYAALRPRAPAFNRQQGERICRLASSSSSSSSSSPPPDWERRYAHASSRMPSAMRQAMYREFGPRAGRVAAPVAAREEEEEEEEAAAVLVAESRSRVRPTPVSRYMARDPSRGHEAAERRRLNYHHSIDPHKIHEIHVPAEIPVPTLYHDDLPSRYRRLRHEASPPRARPVYYEAEEVNTTAHKRRRVSPSTAAPPVQPLYESEYGLAVLETSKPLVGPRYVASRAYRRPYVRGGPHDLEKVDSPLAATSRISYSGDKGLVRTSLAETSTPPPVPRSLPVLDAERTEHTPLTTLVLKSKEFLKSKSLVRNRHDEIDWVATFLKVGFDSSSIYALMCPLRKGRWKSEEEKFTMGLLRLIENGTILLRHGQSIRGYIGEKLHSDDMRVLKKLSNCKMFHFAKLINPRLAEEQQLDMTVAGAREGMERLNQLKGEFLRSVQLEALVAVRKYLSDSSLRDLLNVRA